MKAMLEIMDTTLRDGEQTSGVSFTSLEKLTLAKLLLIELNEYALYNIRDELKYFNSKKTRKTRF